ncbi:murein hydrolase activator EnvC family protein [Leifsonia sp. RAF41]|uniref:murein hydrolase activator EnvC family protein n=1 Tax=Leifsonia sp. RAF41 TaxID=3233056 RepID=UPI003F958876
MRQYGAREAAWPGRRGGGKGLLVAAVLAAVVVSAGASSARAAQGSPNAVTAGAAEVTARVRAASISGGVWAWPLQPPVLTGAYAAPPTRYAAGHRGIDLQAGPGVVVTAPDDAVIRFSGMVVDRPVVTLDHGGGVLSSYEPVESEAPVGSVVGRGAVVGTVASGGHCDARCLHVGVRVDGEYVSPLLFFSRVEPAILLPLGGG